LSQAGATADATRPQRKRTIKEHSWGKEGNETASFRHSWRKMGAVAQDRVNGDKWYVAYAILGATRHRPINQVT